MMTKQYRTRPRMGHRLERLILNAVPRHAAWIVALALLHGCGDVVGPAATRASLVSRSMAASPAMNATADIPQTFYGPERFTRSKGAPETFVSDISTIGYIAPFVLHVQSGDASGAGAVSSASVTLDGNTLLGPSAFNARGGTWAIPVTVGATAHLSVSLASAPGGHLDVWMEGQPAALFCPGTAGAYSSLQAAVDAAPDGGTVLVCEGTHSITDVFVTHPVTIAGIGSTKPVLDATAARCYGIAVRGVTGGPVLIRGLRVQNGPCYDVFVGGPNAGVTVTESEFIPGDGSGVGTAGSTGSPVLIQNSAFIGGGVGVAVDQSGNITILNNTFTGQEGAAIHVTDKPSGPSGPVTIQGNTIRDCGTDWCVYAGRSLSAIGNTFTIDNLHPTNSPLFLDGASGGSSVVTDNEIVGTGSGGTNRYDRNTYPITSHAILITGAAEVRRNHIVNAYTGIGPTPAGVVGSDNVIEHTFAPFSGGGPQQQSTIDMTRNDLLDYVVTLNDPAAFVAGGVNLKCNYWGSSSGPVASAITGFNDAYVPFATQPIANQPGVTCAP